MYEKIINEEAKKRADKVIADTRTYLAKQLADLGLPSSHCDSILRKMANVPGSNTAAIEQQIAKNVIAEIIENMKSTSGAVTETMAPEATETESNDPLSDFLSTGVSPREQQMRDELFKSGYEGAHTVKLDAVKKNYNKLISANRSK